MHRRDRGALGVSGLIKLVVIFGVLGVLGYDTFVTVATHLKAESDAQNAAYAASQAWFNAPSGQQSAQTAYNAAQAYLAGDPKDHVCAGASDPQCGAKGYFMVDADGTVHLVVRREANTLVFSHLGFLHHFLIAFEKGDANYRQD
jgi:hypothetical protein